MTKRDVLRTGILALLIAGPWAGAPGTRADGEPARYDESTMSKPTVIHKVAPEYPKEAKEEGVQGDVVLEAVITTEGAVRETRVVKGEDARLVTAAQNAVGQWRFEPVRDTKGEPTEVLFAVTLRFKLDGRKK